MNLTKNKIISIVLSVSFIVSFLLPTLQGPMNVKLNGFYTYGLHLASLSFVEGFGDYMMFLFTALTNLWVLILLIWSFRKKVKLIPVLILGGWAFSSALFWMVNMENTGVLLIGYWVWLLTILAVIVFDAIRAVEQ